MKMLPLIPNGAFSGLEAPSVEVPPPPYFRAAAGRVTSASYSTLEHFLKDGGNTAARKAGLRFERKFFKYLKGVYPQASINPWIMFNDSSGRRYCRPDFIIRKPETQRVLIGEVKIQHMPEAWWQLRRLYEPVVRVLHPNSIVRVVEVVQSYDPSMPFPESVRIISNIVQAFDHSTMSVLVWKP